MDRTYEYRMTEKDAGRTVEEFLKGRGYSKKLIIHLRNTPLGLTMGGEPVYTTRKLAAGERLTVRLLDKSSERIVPTLMKLHILYEDEDLIVIDKPAGLPVHPSQGNYDNTLANGLVWYYGQRGEKFVYRAVSRLDRDTTGALVLAKHMLSACILYDMAKEGKIKKTYLALASGRTEAGGTIEAPIARAAGSTIERCVDCERGEYACTEYETLLYHEAADCSLVKLRLKTGRTHQIRVHMKHIGHPLPGDFLYNPDYSRIGRQALHSWKLEFDHPMTGEPMAFTAELPEDFRNVLGESEIFCHILSCEK